MSLALPETPDFIRCLPSRLSKITVNSEIFARVLFLRNFAYEVS